MRLIKNENHLIVDYDNPHGIWTLCIIDDFWYAPADYLAFANENYDEIIQEEYLKHLDSETKISAGVVGLMPVYCAALKDLKQLIFFDFPRDDIKKKLFMDWLKKDDIKYHGAFLIDIRDEMAHAEAAERTVIPLLNEHKIPGIRCAFFTLGYDAETPIAYLIKRDVRETRGAEVVQWWDRMLGKISYQFFADRTLISSFKSWHNPSELERSKRIAGFPEFVKQQAKLEAYGVWAWLLQVLDSEESLTNQQYAYLCGKSFLRSGEKNESVFPLTALRGLIFGLCRGLTDQRFVPVIENPPELPRELINVENAMEDDYCLGCCKAGELGFGDLAIRFRNWLYLLETEFGGNARIANMEFCRTPCVHISILLTHKLPSEAFNVDGIGQVNRGWRSFCECWRPENQPHVCNEGREIILSFDIAN
jgi:hypothetical protein